MSTKKLAKELGLLRQRSQSSSGSKKSLVSNQIFSYLIVIDFESTCWTEKNNYSQEIIEFPAVLLNTSSGEVESEFHTYVQPQEHPILSKFCTELTGITQVQVEAGIPLQICLSRFCRWIQNLQLEKGVVFPNRQQRCSAPSPSQKLCTFLTWSDWDLGVCLQYECKRKQLHKPEVLNSWIDLRSTYRLFYNRKPKGLNGALQDLGIQFSGREHSGLDDSRNTAQLAARMMRDGCVMKITRSLERTPSTVKPMFGNTTADKKEKANTDKEENTLTTTKPSSPKNPPKPYRSDWYKYTPVGTQQEVSYLRGAAVELVEEEESEELLVEAEERCASYDHVVLEGAEDDVINGDDRECDTEYVSDFDSGCYVWEDSDNSHLRANMSVENNSKTSDLSTASVSTKKIRTDQLKKMVQHSAISEPDTYFAVPKAVTWGSKTNGHEIGLKTSLHLREKSDGGPQTSKTNTPSLLRHKSFIPENTSTPNTSFAKPRPVTTQNRKHKKTPSSFTIYTDPAKQAATPSHPSSSRSYTPKNVLCSLSANTLSSCTSRSFISAKTRGQKITSPLCVCGRRAKRQVVSNGGPNQGRGFYCCPVRRSGSGGRIQKGCEFFKWESSLMKSCAVPAVGSSVSFCQISSALNCRPQQRSTLRKSY
ncbi:ERI1 exoribonuclease 2 [Seriola dumerili]|uniref:ERI1 exoribonuclease 2 n=1 Tax=Seriola dumerili TaxID=41447 RepID=UPI000BBF28E1|nr:ERI1 exoribonuclease 2 [Seriola dumerili]